MPLRPRRTLLLVSALVALASSLLIARSSPHIVSSARSSATRGSSLLARTRTMATAQPLKNTLDKHVVVVGGSYVGLAVAQELLKLDEPPRVTVVERNEHFSHLCVPLSLLSDELES